VLIQDPQPSFYLIATRYRVATETYRRWGLIAQVGLEPFGAGGHILPHEKTFPQIKSERLGLMRSCRMNISPIFAVFDDRDDLMITLQKQAGAMETTIDFEDDEGARHCMWRLTDAGSNRAVQDAFTDLRLYIADGHHRYETCLAFRDECARETAGVTDRHPADSTLIYISSMQDPGLQVLPTHRALPTVDDHLKADFIQRARAHFDCREFPVGDDAAAATQRLSEALQAIPAEAGLGVAIQGDTNLYLLQVKPQSVADIYTPDIPEPLRRLNVTLLSEFVLPRLLGMGADTQEDAQRIHFRHSAVTTVEAVHKGDYAMAFILNATPVDQVRRIAEAGLSMPRKTTYFTPKVITGLVMRDLTTT
jgi:uncharacterized protein (DUF1015 family)